MSSDTSIPFSFPPVTEPEVSIIIAAFNQWTFTNNCLRSIVEYTDEIGYEVILVDNGSEDETSYLPDHIGNLVLIRNENNEGYVRACNQGAASSRGSILVFLNNDVVVRPGWLGSLLTTFDRPGKVGIVCAKLLFPDGRLQEAGGIIWNNGSGWNYGRFDDPGRPQYNFVREVDYCSGACLAIKKEVFELYQGFDELYHPGYCEDSDLCIGVRKLGYQVVYQPRAEVMHHEGITAGRSTISGMKAFQAVNTQKLQQKWQSRLQVKHWPPSLSLLWRARRHGRKPEMLMVDHFVPMYDRDSGSFYMWNLIRLFMELGWNITFYQDFDKVLTPYTEELQQQGVEVISGQTTFEDFIKERPLQFDLALLRRPELSIPKLHLIRQVSPFTRIIYDTADLHHLREQRRAEVEGSRESLRSSEQYKAVELYLARTADITLAVTEDDRQHLLHLDPGLNIAVVPNIHPIPDHEAPAFEDRSGIMFLGNYIHHPNVDGVNWFIAEVWPLIRKRLLECIFYVVGNHASPTLDHLEKTPGVKVVGWVPEVGPWFDRCRVFVSPLRYGSGMKGKIGHAMSYRLPVVTTGIGAEGMELREGINTLVADDAEEFAAAVIKLHETKDLWQSMADQAFTHIQQKYTLEATKIRLAAVLRSMGLPVTYNEKRSEQP